MTAAIRKERAMESPKNGTVPNPDPTERTVEQLLREISTSRETIEAVVDGKIKTLEQRLTGMDKAIELIQAGRDRIPGEIETAVKHLGEVVNEKLASVKVKIEEGFAGIEKQFLERDKRTEQLSLADKTAINAALAAQEKQAVAQNEGNTTANNKMENNFTKLIEQNQTLLETVTKNTEAQISDLKSRLDKGEGRTSVSDPATMETLKVLNTIVTDLKTRGDQTQGQSKGADALWGYILGGIGLIATLGTIFFMMVKNAS